MTPRSISRYASFTDDLRTLSTVQLPFGIVIWLCLTLTCCLSACSRTFRPANVDADNPLAEFRYSCESLDSATVAKVLPQLERLYGGNLAAEHYRDKLLAAMSFYPDLTDVPIRLVQRKLRTSMAARPHAFRFNGARRGYTIYVDDVRQKAADFRNASYAAQVGCFIHELGHIAYYVTRSNLGLVGDGAAYVTNQSFKNGYERIADRMAIHHGGGYYVYLYRTFTFEEAELPPAYLAFKRRNYTDNQALLARHIEYLQENSLEKCVEYWEPVEAE